MRNILLVLLLGLSVYSFAQTGTKSKEPFRAFEGTTFKVGDSITMGFGANYDKKFKCLKMSDDYLGHEYLNWNKCVIKRFGKYDNGGRVAMVKFKGDIVSWELDINCGLKNGEIALYPEQYAKTSKNDLVTDSLALLHFIKSSNAEAKKYAEEYLYRFYHTRYKQVREDEFEFYDAKSAMEKEIAESKTNLDFNKGYSIFMIIEVGNYDIEKGYFPIIWKSNYFELLSSSDHNIFEEIVNVDKERLKLTDLNLAFVNYKDFDKLPLDRDMANSFVKRRKDEKGNVDRRIYVQVNYVLMDSITIITKKDFENISLSDVNESSLLAEIKSMEIYDHNSYMYNGLGILKQE